jgi:hypothetical protein
MRIRNWLLIAAVLMTVILLAACGGGSEELATPAVGPAGPPGPVGPQGPAGAQSEPGPPGPAAAEYVGDQVCAGCHPDLYKSYMKTGHTWALNKITDGTAPSYPFTKLSQLPDGYTWDDILYVIGGYNWKALFVDKEGYIITDAPGQSGNADYENQLNFKNVLVGKEEGWVHFQSGQEDLLYTCGECHSTGYTSSSNQDGVPGLMGTWFQDGVRCEACHGPGSLHMTNPQKIPMQITRTSDLCSRCHSQADMETVEDSTGFDALHKPAEMIYRGKHMVIECVDCHDPHTGVIQQRQAKLAPTSTQCVECHYKEGQTQNVGMHERLEIACQECHMPRMTQTAWGNPARYIGDIHSHQVAIDPTKIDQVVDTGNGEVYTIAPNGLNFACRHCHVPGTAQAKTDEELIGAASGYHGRP